MTTYKDYRYSDEHDDHSHVYLRKKLLRMLGPHPGTILDLGCGNGSLTKYLINKGFDVYGTDASETGIAIAKKTHPDRFEVQDLTSRELPGRFKEMKFQTIISIEVIEHLYDPKDFIGFCKNILVKSNNGALILSTPYHGYIKNLAISLAGKWDAHADPLWDGGHIKLWSPKTLKKLLREQGLSTTDLAGCGRVPWLWKSFMVKAVI